MLPYPMETDDRRQERKTVDRVIHRVQKAERIFHDEHVRILREIITLASLLATTACTIGS